MINIFISYSHANEVEKERLIKHLSLLKREKLISVWHDRELLPGQDFGETISNELRSSKLVLLLISADFLASDYCIEKEMKIALSKLSENKSIVVPIILHPCDWYSAPFGNLNALPIDGKPISKFTNQEEAWEIVARGIRRIVNNISETSSNQTGKDFSDFESLHLRQPFSSNKIKLKKEFSDLEKEEFMESSFEFIAEFFQNSLRSLEKENEGVQTKFRRLDLSSFAVIIYQNGKKIAECSIIFRQGIKGMEGIAFSTDSSAPKNSMNELLSITIEDSEISLKAMGMPMYDVPRDRKLSQLDAAEYYWNLLLRHIQ